MKCDEALKLHEITWKAWNCRITHHIHSLDLLSFLTLPDLGRKEPRQSVLILFLGFAFSPPGAMSNMFTHITCGHRTLVAPLQSTWLPPWHLLLPPHGESTKDSALVCYVEWLQRSFKESAIFSKAWENETQTDTKGLKAKAAKVAKGRAWHPRQLPCALRKRPVATRVWSMAQLSNLCPKRKWTQSEYWASFPILFSHTRALLEDRMTLIQVLLLAFGHQASSFSSCWILTEWALTLSSHTSSLPARGLI